jgi:hypothetical protein
MALTKPDCYRQILKEAIEAHVHLKRRSEGIEFLPVFDDEHDNYLLLRVGWDKTGRAHFVIFHARLKDEKVLIEFDGIEQGMIDTLIAAGIPREDIFLSDRRPDPVSLADLAA